MSSSLSAPLPLTNQAGRLSASPCVVLLADKTYFISCRRQLVPLTHLPRLLTSPAQLERKACHHIWSELEESGNAVRACAFSPYLIRRFDVLFPWPTYHPLSPTLTHSHPLSEHRYPCPLSTLYGYVQCNHHLCHPGSLIIPSCPAVTFEARARSGSDLGKLKSLRQ